MARLFPSLLLSTFLAVGARDAWAADLPAHLEVSRGSDALTCPDATQLAARVAETVGYDALDTADAPHYGRFAVVFAHLETGFVATVQREEPRPVARTLAETKGSCHALAGAAVVALALMLDQLEAPPDASPALLSPPPPPEAPMAPKRLWTPPAEAPEVKWAAKRQWYGWQTLSIDAVAAAMALTSFSPGLSYAPSTTLMGTGVALYGLAPFVHGVHHRWGIYGADMGLRVGAVAAGAVVGLAAATSAGLTTSCTSDGSCTTKQSGLSPTTGALIGGGLGALLASAIDGAVFARERVRAEDPDAAAPQFSWAPSISPSAHGVTAGVGGLF